MTKQKTKTTTKGAVKSVASTKKRATKTPIKKAAASRSKKTVAPKGIKHHAKRLYRLTPKFIHGMVVGAFVGIVVLVPLGKVGTSSALSINSGQDCDKYSIINCGVKSTSDLLAKYRASNYVKASYSSMGISASEISNMDTTAVAGTAFADGTIKVDGKVVAKNIHTEARLRVTSGDQVVKNDGHTMFKRALASSWSHDKAPAYVVMKNNVFQFAILAPCGNPLTGTATTSPPPQFVERIKVCDLKTLTIVTIDDTAFNTTRYSKNLNDCTVKLISVCDIASQKVITINERDFNSATQSKDLAACTPPPGVIVVCDLTTKTILSITENQFDASKYSKDFAACTVVVIKVCDLTTLQIITINENEFNSSIQSKDAAACTPPPGTIVVCELATKTMVTIPESEFDATKHSKDSADCQPGVVLTQTTTTLPNTGPGAVLIVFGLSILGGYVFHMKHLHGKHKKRAYHHHA